MAVEILMPKLGMTMEEGKLVEWLKSEAEEIVKGELLFVIESDKVTFEVEAPGSGILSIRVDDGENIAVGTVLGYLAESRQEYESIVKGSETPDLVPDKKPEISDAAKAAGGGINSAPVDDPAAGKVKASPAARALAKIRWVNLEQIRGTGPNGRITKNDVLGATSGKLERAPEAEAGRKEKASPGARKLAREIEVDLTKVQGTGPNQRITREDVVRAAAEHGRFREETNERPPAKGKRLLREEPMTGIRRTISRRMTESLQTAAQMTAFGEWDVTDLLKLRVMINSSEGKTPYKVSFPGLMVFFLARVLKEMPIFNASVSGETIHYWQDINIGVAVAVGDALVVPVIHEADSKSLEQIQVELADLIDRARAKTLLPDDMVGGTFTISNVGSYGSQWETVILNPPEVALLGIGTIQKKPIVREDQIAVREMMPISLTFDHRVIDGATAGAFRNRMKALVENPGIVITCF